MRISNIFALTLFLVFASPIAIAQEIEFFWATGCPYCDQQKEWLQVIDAEYDVVINDFSVGHPENIDYLVALMDEYNVPARDRGRVPITFIQDEYFIGFNLAIAQDIEAILTGTERERRTENVIEVPFFGDINMSAYSLPALAIILGFVDGFNVCSIGALIFILSIVIGLGSRRRIIVIGSAFIIAVVAAYWVLIFLWYQFFTILQQYFNYVNVLVGLIAIGGGIYYFRQFLRFIKYGPTCDASGGSLLRKTRQGIREVVTTPKSTFSLIAGVMGFAVLVTLIEFPCSAGIPAAFTGVLALADLPALTYLWYVTLYTLFYMLVEIIVFVTAVVSAKIWLANAKFVTWSTLVGAIVLIGLGLYYLSLLF